MRMGVADKRGIHVEEGDPSELAVGDPDGVGHGGTAYASPQGGHSTELMPRHLSLEGTQGVLVCRRRGHRSGSASWPA